MSHVSSYLVLCLCLIWYPLCPPPPATNWFPLFGVMSYITFFCLLPGATHGFSRHPTRSHSSVSSTNVVKAVVHVFQSASALVRQLWAAAAGVSAGGRMDIQQDVTSAAQTGSQNYYRKCGISLPWAMLRHPPVCHHHHHHQVLPDSSDIIINRKSVKNGQVNQLPEQIQ